MKKGLSRFLIGLLVAAFFLAVLGFWFSLKSNVQGRSAIYINIPGDSDFEDVKRILDPHLQSAWTFQVVAHLRDYPNLVKSGRYKIEPNMGNLEIVHVLRAGIQEPVMVTIPAPKSLGDLCFLLAKQLELDSAQLKSAFEIQFKEMGISPKHYACYLIPNTYEFYWNASSSQVFEQLHLEYKKFWNEDREAKAKKLKLSFCEVSTLASIVQKETSKVDEMPIIAGVYLNRLKIGMRLQADPTLIFAAKNKEIKRVLNVDKDLNSPYNTYKYAGLPPGPICIPDVVAMEAVLNAKKHQYLYFCAKEDFSGYHNFARTYSEHLKNAAKYQRELNRRGILR
ncbi:MAG: endolytic transglycosylase MltG [Luteibaculum sp.]